MSDSGQKGLKLLEGGGMKRAISSNDGAVPEGFGARQNGKPGAWSGFFGEQEGTSAGRVRICCSSGEASGIRHRASGVAELGTRRAERDADGTDGSDEVSELTGVLGVSWFS